jgi:hypothetical protein
MAMPQFGVPYPVSYNPFPVVLHPALASSFPMGVNPALYQGTQQPVPNPGFSAMQAHSTDSNLPDTLKPYKQGLLFLITDACPYEVDCISMCI